MTAGDDAPEEKDDAPRENGDDTAVGDTPQAHDEINPHDLPPDHPGRQAAEEQAGGAEGTTRGDDELTDASPARDGRSGEPGR